MERKLGEIFELQGKWYKVIEDKKSVCDKCVFCPIEESICSPYRDIIGHCFSGNRQDKTSVIFEEVENKPKVITSNLSNKKKLLLII